MLLTQRAVRHPSVPYVLPFAVFIAFLGMQHYALLPAAIDPALRVLVLTAVLAIFSRSVISLRTTSATSSILLGIAVFAIWVAPDLVFPHYREHWLFQNRILGMLGSSLSESLRSDPFTLICRSIRTVILVPIIEELFWRAWLMRWFINPRFEAVSLGAYTAGSFWITAALFASEHGPYWDVGLIAGLLYNWWMIRTKSLGDCILAHAVTNGCLTAYVIATGQWQYWL
jgi:CAAX prenyl protease-like protein